MFLFSPHISRRQFQTSRNSHGQLRALGVSGIERKLAENHAKTHESISQVHSGAAVKRFLGFRRYV